MGLNLSLLLRPWTISTLLLLYSCEAWNFGVNNNPFQQQQQQQQSSVQQDEPSSNKKFLFRASMFSPAFFKVIEGIVQTFVPQPVIHFAIDTVPAVIRTIVLYKPPVGITAVYMTLRFLLSRNKRIISALLLEQAEEDAQQRLTTKRFYRRRLKRSLDLDYTDRLYDLLGGVEAVRAELYVAALDDIIRYWEMQQMPNTQQQNIYLQRSNSTASFSYSVAELATAAKNALLIRSTPRSSREFFVERMIPYLGPLDDIYHCQAQDEQANEHKRHYSEILQDMIQQTCAASFSKKQSLAKERTDWQKNHTLQENMDIDDKMDTTLENATADILWGATKTAEIRSLDALLRILRDRLLTSADRIARIEKHCQWRLRWYESGLGRGWRIWFRKTVWKTTLEDDRRILQLTTAALKRELERLGQIQRLLLTRPRELSDSYLLMASSSALGTPRSKPHHHSHIQTEKMEHDTDSALQQVLSVSSRIATQLCKPFTMIWTSQSILERMNKIKRLFPPWTSHGRTNRKRTGTIHASGARLALSTAASPQGLHNFTGELGFQHQFRHGNWITSLESASGHHVWADVSQQWTQRARLFIRDILVETMSPLDPSSSFDEDEDRHTTVAYDMMVVSKWASYEVSDEEGWLTVLSLVDDIATARLVQEKKFLPTVMDIKYWKKHIDIWGIPSSIATIVMADKFHVHIVKPYSTNIVEASKKLLEIIWGIVEFRFYVPIRDIILDLLNRRPKLLDPFALENEQRSLDNMLRDLGVKGETRAESIAAASRMYEQQLAQGAIFNLMRGQMVRLLLIQVQQLKAGLLQAMGSIDDLMDSNRLNVQLLASIPAVLIITYGTRFFFASLYRLRARDITGPRTAHLAMSELLSKMGRCLHLASHDTDLIELTPIHTETAQELKTISNVALKPQELGEFVLYMHEYLTILDYCEPVFSKILSDAIHESLQELLLHGQLTTKRQLALLELVEKKHNELIHSYK